MVGESGFAICFPCEYAISLLLSSFMLQNNDKTDDDIIKLHKLHLPFFLSLPHYKESFRTFVVLMTLASWLLSFLPQLTCLMVTIIIHRYRFHPTFPLLFSNLTHCLGHFINFPVFFSYQKGSKHNCTQPKSKAYL